MRGVDLSRFSFDSDLTFAVLLMNGDGKVYHRYGTRAWDDPDGRLSMAGLVRVMKQTLVEHRAVPKGTPPPPRPREVVEKLWTEAGKPATKECFHCHMVGEARRGIARREGRWDPFDIYKYPQPEQVGLVLDRDDQQVVTEVVAGSPAAKAGIRKGDRLTSVGGVGVLTMADVQWELDRVPAKGGSVGLRLQNRDATLTLADGWKVTDPLAVSWRATMWDYSPEPGFGGEKLKAADLKALGLPEDAWAFKVTYLVTWGEKQASGQNAVKAGIQKGDVVTAINGKRDFKSVPHYQSWFRFTQKPGSTIPVELYRGKEKRTVQLQVVK